MTRRSDDHGMNDIPEKGDIRYPTVGAPSLSACSSQVRLRC
jgi:hypothetical protein